MGYTHARESSSSPPNILKTIPSRFSLLSATEATATAKSFLDLQPSSNTFYLHLRNGSTKRLRHTTAFSSTCKNIHTRTRAFKASNNNTDNSSTQNINASMSSITMAPVRNPNHLQFPMPSIAPMPTRIKREPAWLKVDLSLDGSFFSRKRKASHVVEDTPVVSQPKRQCPEGKILDQIAKIVSLNNVSGTSSSSTSTDGGRVAKTMSRNTLISIARSGKTMSPRTSTKTLGHRLIKCRVTGYLRRHLLLDDAKDMWDAKDEMRWNLWCEKEKEERVPVQGYEDGDSDYEWEEFKEPSNSTT
ncbi:hypothetical protein BKA65DRAFT_478723 [Rhexocercosporidium sp. MPI-PUGE-AT-0058]|nr:hypothetical protein BKA65DRAFT_478723 [Rhexocercosporidium sp. MPI-PUGE-AT-0058]